MDAPLDLYIAAYDDPSAAKQDYDDLKKLQHGGYIFIDGAVLVSREADGKLTVGDRRPRRVQGHGLGDRRRFRRRAVRAAAAGRDRGRRRSRRRGRQARQVASGARHRQGRRGHDQAGHSGVVAVFEEIRVEEVETALARATKKAVKQVDKEEAREAQGRPQGGQKAGQEARRPCVDAGQPRVARLVLFSKQGNRIATSPSQEVRDGAAAGRVGCGASDSLRPCWESP